MRSTWPARPPNPWLVQMPKKAASPSEMAIFRCSRSSNTNSSTGRSITRKKRRKRHSSSNRPDRSGWATASKSAANSTRANRQRWRMVASAVVGASFPGHLRPFQTVPGAFLTITRQLICGRFLNRPGTVGVGRCPRQCRPPMRHASFLPATQRNVTVPPHWRSPGARRDTGGGVSGPARTRAYGPARPWAVRAFWIASNILFVAS